MDRIEKALARLSKKERARIRAALQKIQAKDFAHLDCKKLKGHGDIFRVRKGDVRIILRITKDGEVFILAIERRNDTTYREF